MTADPTMLIQQPTQTEPRSIPRYARADVIGGAAMVLVAGLIWFGAVELRVGTLISFGPGAMPRVLAAILAVAGLAMLFRGLFLSTGAGEAVHLAYRPSAILGIAFVVFAVFIRGGDFWFVTTPQLGLMIVGPVTVFIAGLATPEARPRELLLLSLGMTAIVLLVFPDLLGVPIPVFPKVLQDAIPPSFGVATATRVLYVAYGLLTAALYLVLYKLPRRHHG